MQIDKTLISVIVPVYNVEKYLKRCVDSIICQTYENIEIILVDDGSTDNCGNICDQYQKEHNNIRVIHQENSGLSAARNTGIQVANGAYIGFVDSDDFIDENMYKKLYDTLCMTKAQIAIGGIQNYYSGKIEKNISFDGQIKVYDSKQAIYFLLVNEENITAHAVTKLYSREIFEHIEFPVGKLYEDVATVVKFFMEADKIAVVNTGVYYYWHRSDSIVETSFSKRDMDLLEAWRENERIILEKIPELKEAMDYRYLWSCFYLLDKICVQKKVFSEEAEIIRILRKSCGTVLHNKYFRKTRKFGAIILKCNRLCYRILSRLQTYYTNR